MKVKVIKDCYYNLEFIKAGRIIDFKGKNLPSWATLADGIETKKEKKAEKPLDNVGQDETKEADANSDKKEDGKSSEEKSKDEKANDDEAKKEYLEELLNKAFEKGIFIEDTDKKSAEEQIKELEEVLKKGE